MDTFEPLITIRAADPNEYGRVIELSHDMYSATDSLPKDETFVSDPIEWLGAAMNDGNAQAAIAYDSATNAIVASGIGIVDTDPASKDRIGYIRWMSTTKDFRGFGVGEQILNYLMKWFKENGIEKVQLHATDKAVEFYSQHGFVQGDTENMWWKNTD